MKETSLYVPVKRFLEGLGLAPKGEIRDCDVVALSAGEPPLVVVCELKLQFSFELLLQAVDRAGACDEVWLAARIGNRGGRERDARFRALCRRLGFGLLGIFDTGEVEMILSPAAPPPRRDPRRRSLIVDEHRRRRGDPTAGGGSRQPIMTAYRQEALACAAALAEGPRRRHELRAAVPTAGKIVQANHYGWFERTERGVYGLTAAGRQALAAATSSVPAEPMPRPEALVSK
jgi:hypothetical protein